MMVGRAGWLGFSQTSPLCKYFFILIIQGYSLWILFVKRKIYSISKAFSSEKNAEEHKVKSSAFEKA